MHASGWIRLFRRIPSDQIDNLALVTTSGTELSLQTLIRIEEEMLIVRARVSGSSDAGRAFCVPYDQINFLGFLKPIKEEDLRAMFDGPEVWPTATPCAEPVPLAYAAPAPTVLPAPAEAELDPAVAALAIEPPPATLLPGPRESRPLPSKSKVLANLRARLKLGGDSPPPR